MTLVSEEKPLLYHYTTSQGLLGIISSQQIHATSISYLNDAQEHSGYLTNRLPQLLHEWVLRALRKKLPVLQLPSVEVIKKQNSDAELITTGLIEALKTVSKQFDDPYVASFSAPPAENPEDGLLSQWRGYGVDGGYAIVLETKEIERLLLLESAVHHHQFLTICDVDYHYNGIDDSKRLPETINDERDAQIAIEEFLETQKQESLEKLALPITQLSIRSKHHGFSEEQEVRIVSLRSVPEVWKTEKEAGEPRSRNEIQFRGKGGVLIPYQALFGEKLGEDVRLPIKKIIVGPHAEKSLRRESVVRLLKKYNIDVPVTESSIPYLAT